MLTTLASRKEQKYNSLPYGYAGLDKILGGMYSGEFIIIGARPSVGKSQLMLEIALNTAKHGHTVLFASAEMSMEQLNDRELSMKTGISMQRIRQGRLSDMEWGKVQGIVAEIADTPIYFIPARLRADNIVNRAKSLKQMKGLSLVVVDYIQLLSDKTDRKVNDNLRERIGYVSNVMKNMAVELSISVIAASQLNREVEMRQEHRPMLSDLKESGDLEQDADVVLLLHRPELYDANKDKGILEIGIAKTRQLGMQGIVKLVWLEKEHRYVDMAINE